MKAALLFEQQNKLQIAAEKVLHDLGLMNCLSSSGKPVAVGSFALGLMVWRDIDITVICSQLNVEAVTKIATYLMGHQHVQKVAFKNDTGHWNIDPKYPDGLYLAITYQQLQGESWNLDIWFIDEPDRQPDLAHLKTMTKQLNPTNKAIILTLKTEWHDKPEYRKSVTSYDIYNAVLNHGVETANAFQEWLQHNK